MTRILLSADPSCRCCSSADSRASEDPAALDTLAAAPGQRQTSERSGSDRGPRLALASDSSRLCAVACNLLHSGTRIALRTCTARRFARIARRNLAAVQREPPRILSDPPMQPTRTRQALNERRSNSWMEDRTPHRIAAVGCGGCLMTRCRRALSVSAALRSRHPVRRQAMERHADTEAASLSTALASLVTGQRTTQARESDRSATSSALESRWSLQPPCDSRQSRQTARRLRIKRTRL